jgi:4-amino-4-deoxy-L-arabinose transferase-like glycosyltransferase
MVTYPIAALFAVFGPGEIQASVWALVCSLLSVLVVYRLGSVVHGHGVGLIAALLCAVYPLEVINGTRILSDVQVGLFSSVALLCMIHGGIRRSPALYVFSGAAAACAYLANGRGLLLAFALIATSACLVWLRKAELRSPLWVTGGFLAVFSVEAVVYYATTGHALLSYQLQSSAAYFKYLHEPVLSVSVGPLQVEYTNGRPLDLIRGALLLKDGPTNQFGLFFFLFGAATLSSFVRRENVLLAALAVGLYAAMEFGPLRLDVDWSRGDIHYLMLFKGDRFLLMLTGPLVVTAAYFLRTIARTSVAAAALITVVVLATAVPAIAHTHGHYRSGLSDLRAAAAEVLVHSDKTFFGDLWAVLHLSIFTHYEAQNLQVLNRDDQPDRIKNGCIMLGGSRGVELQADYVESTLPPFAREVLERGTAPPGWRQIREVRGPRTPMRRHDFKIFCVP